MFDSVLFFIKKIFFKVKFSTLESDSDFEISSEQLPDEIIEFTKQTNASTRGGDLLFDNLGNKYQLKRISSEAIIWRCSIRNPHCPAQVKENTDYDFELVGCHTCSRNIYPEGRFEIYQRVF